MHRTLASVSLALLAAFGLGCTMLGLGKSKEPVAARVGDEVITVAELDAQIKEDLWKRQTGDGNPSRVHELRMSTAKSLVAQRALEAEAKKRGLTPEAMLDAEFKKLPPVDDAAVKAFYDQNSAQLQGAPLEAVAPRIRSHLEGEAKRKAVEAILAKTETKIELVRPRVEVSAGGPARGPADARVTIVEFSDFQCPHCKTFHEQIFPALQRLYGDQVRWIFVNRFFPGAHQYAEQAAIGGECALRQGKFWEYADYVFANQERLGDGVVDRAASEVGLDEAGYTQCLTGRETASEVAADQAEAARIGVGGTPYFLVNGHEVLGAQPVGVFNEVIAPYFEGQ